MTIALVQKVANNGGNNTTVAATLSGVAAGDFIVIIVAGNSGATGINSVTDGSGNTVSSAVTYATTGSHAGIGIYYVQNTSSGTHLITVTWAAANAGQIFLAEYSGVATSALDVASAIATGATTAVASPSITPAGNGELIIFGVGQQSAGLTLSSFTGVTAEATQNAAAPTSGWGDLIQATAAAISGGCTSSSTAGWSAAIAAFKPSGVTAIPSRMLTMGC